MTIIVNILLYVHKTFVTATRKCQNPEKVEFPGAPGSYFTNKLEFIHSIDAIPTYRVMDKEGKVLVPEEEPKVMTFSLRYRFLADANNHSHKL